jgi:hypothetical protein
VTFTATVSGTGGTPSGKVQFNIDGQNFGNAVALFGGKATSGATSSLSVTSHTVTAAYSGDTNFASSTSSLSGGQTVVKANTTTTVTSSPNTSMYGQSITFTATVTAGAPGAGKPTGMVTFMDGASTLGLPVTLASSGKATYSTSALPTANNTVTAVYSGDTNFNTSASSHAVSQVVNKANTTTKVTSSAATSASGQPVTFTATVSVVAPGSGTPSGTVQFKIGGTNFGSPVALSSGSATSSATTTLSVGSHTITAVYNGDTNFNGSISAGLTQVVN